MNRANRGQDIPLANGAAITVTVGVTGDDELVAFNAEVELTWKKWYARAYGSINTEGDGVAGFEGGYDQLGVFVEGGNEDMFRHIDPNIAEQIGGSGQIGIRWEIPGT